MTAPTSTAIQKEHSESRIAWLLLGLIFFSLYAFATLAPRGATWGLHSLAFFPPALQIAGLAICLALLCRPLQRKLAGALRPVVEPLLQPSLRGSLFLVVVGAIAFTVFYCFPIKTDIYGDSRNMLRWNADNTTLRPEWFQQALDPHLLASKEALTVLLHRTVAHVFGISIGDAYRIISAWSGALCLVIWLLYLRRSFSSSRWGALLVVVGCLMGSHQIFFGHVENYPFGFLTSFAFLVSGALMLEERTPLWTVLLLFLLALKAHAAAIYFLPALVVLIAFGLKQRFPALQRFLTWRSLASFIIVPSLMVGACLYFFYFKSFHEPHSGTGRQFQHTFLPIIPGPPPLHKYSLQSLNHILDLGNIILLIGTPVVVGLLGIILIHRRAVDWKHPRMMFATLAVGYPLLFFATVNPELSMPRDWDLYALLGAPLMMFFATILAHSDKRVPSAPVYGTALAFGVFSLGFYAVNATPSRLSLRLEDIGEHVFRTYHAGAGYIINVGQSMEPDSARALERRIATVNRLTPDIVGEDKEYTHLLVKIATSYKQRGDQRSAILWMERAAAVAPHDANVSLWLSDYYLSARQSQKALGRIDAVLSKDPRNLDALMQGAIASAQQRDFEGALAYLRRAGAVAPQDPDIPSWIEQVKRVQTQQKRQG